MEYFKHQEFACRCCRQLPPAVRENIETLVTEVLDPARRAYGGPVLVNSGYRCRKHNAEAGGVANSQHLRGEAADICCRDNARLAKILEEQGRYDQLILYRNRDGSIRFIHVSWKHEGVNRKQILNKSI